ncbi:MAG: KOW domain-containing RNA-binding protein [Clostridia bacterium]|nr:KOW domain-containing RNA-binding protein [Clostridia bacterium]
MSNIQIGQYVRSKAGRDKNHVFIVLEVIDTEYVSLVDGDVRRIERPKKKKIKHLFEFNQISDMVREKIKDDKKLTNLMIRKEIEKFDLNQVKVGGF